MSAVHRPVSVGSYGYPNIATSISLDRNAGIHRHSPDTIFYINFGKYPRLRELTSSGEDFLICFMTDGTSISFIVQRHLGELERLASDVEFPFLRGIIAERRLGRV